MTWNLTYRSLVLAAAVLAAAACQKTQTPPADSNTVAAGAPAGSPAAATGAAPAAPAPEPKVQVCTLLSATEVSALMGKTLVQNGCSYDLDPSAKEKALADSQAQMAKAQKQAQSGDMNGFMKGMMQAGAGQQKMGSTMAEQMNVSVEARRDDETEDAAKAIYAQTGATVRGTMKGALAPEQHGMNGVIQGADEVSGVGDWAFATNVASINMGMGFSSRGRILEARKGPWRVTVSATVAPDPGAAALDQQMAGVAKALIAKL